MGKLQNVDSKSQRCIVHSIQMQKASELARRGEAKRQAGDFDGAIADLDFALQLDANDVAALRSRGDAKRMLDDCEGAIADLDMALKLDPRNSFALRSRGDAKRMLNDHAGALYDLDLALQMEPGNAVALSSRGDAKRMLEDYVGSIADLDVAIQMEPRNGFALSSRAASKRLLGDYAGSIADLDRALQLDPTDAFALRRRGEVKRMAKDFVGAIADLDMALVIEPANSLALWRRGEAKRELGDIQGAMGDLNLALQLEPMNITALCSRGDTKLLLGDAQGAFDDLTMALKLQPQHAQAHRSRGELLKLQGDFHGAIEDFNLALRLEPQNIMALSSRGDCKRMLDDCDGAMADLDLALELDPLNALDLTRRGEVKRELGDYQGALVDLDLVVQMEPHNVVALSSRGDTKRMLHDYVGALEDLDLALQIEPENPFPQCCRAEAEQMDESRWFVEKVATLEPLQQCLMSQQLRWAILGAGTVGLTLALLMAESMLSRGCDPNEACVHVYESQWIEKCAETSKWKRKGAKLTPISPREEVVTLQDSVLQRTLSPALQSAFEGQKSKWIHSQNASVAAIETKLLAKAQEAPFNTFIRIHDYVETPAPIHRAWIESLEVDVVVSCEGSMAPSRRCFEGFVNPKTKGADLEAQQIYNDVEGVEGSSGADYALGITLKPGASKQARFNVIFSMAQSIYLLNSDETSGSGCLNIRITKEEYHEIFDATGHSPAQGSPIRLFGDEDLPLITAESPSMIQLRLPWLKRRIQEGFKLYGFELDQMHSITAFQLRPAYAQCFYRVLGEASKPKLLFLAGEAAISDHFWPCRGLSTGLKSASALAKMWLQCETLAHGARKYNCFMDQSRRYEIHQRSVMLPRRDVPLPWGGQLLRSLESPEAKHLEAMAKEQAASNQQSFLENCKMWRDFLQKSPGWPHESVSDEDLEEQLQKMVRPQDLELHLMVSSTSTRPSSATSTSTAASSAASTVRRSGYGNGNVVIAMANLTTSKILGHNDPSADERWLG